MTRQVFLTPIQSGRTVSLANAGNGLPVMRKRVLPLGKIRHPVTGQWVVFDRPYHQGLIDAFKAGATEQVPLQLANDRNQHNMNPELTRAHIVRLSHQEAGDTDGPGLYADFQPHSKKAAKLLLRNPGLGVSCQVEEGRVRVDGRAFPRLLRHVLATLDPRVVGLGQWRTVSLSDDSAGPVIDLTRSAVKGISMAKSATKAGKSERLELSEEEATAAVDEVLASLGLAMPEPGGADRMAALRALRGKGKGGKKKGRKGGKKTKLSNADRRALLDLSVVSDETDLEVRGIRGELAAQRWQAERATVYRGVPKAFLDLAEPVLASATPAVLSLSNSDGDEAEVDAGQVIRDLLSLVPRLDLSEDDLPGTSLDLAAGDGEDAVDDALSKEWDELSGAPE